MDNEESSVQLADLLQRLSRRLRRAQMSQLAPLGLTPAQERALRLIAQSEEPLRMAELAHQLRIVPRSVTTVIDSLEQAGLVRRAIDPANRRAILLHLTDKGLAVREQMRQARRQASEDLFAPLSGAQRGQLVGLLSALDDPPGDRSQAASAGSYRPLAESAGSDRAPAASAGTDQAPAVSPGSDRAPAASAGSDRPTAASPARERRLRDAAARTDSSASGG
jgi:DNA-binding MarR family transcriptional regulator